MLPVTKKSILWALAGALALLGLYFLILTWANSLAHAWEQFLLLWYWIILLAAGFGTQTGLYYYLRQQIRERQINGLKGQMAASGGLSAGAMIACCAHHLVDVLPLLGLSAAFIFLAQYQLFFILLGLASNLFGIIFMLEIIQKHSFFSSSNMLNKPPWAKIRKWSWPILIIILIVAFFAIKYNRTAPPVSEQTVESTGVSLPTVSNEGGGLTIEITPINYVKNAPLQFEVSLNTHQGDLNFDLLNKTKLFDDKNNGYLPQKWQGGSGGHHLSGKLIFPPLTEKTNKIKLIIKDIYDVKERIFEWNLE